MGGSINVTIRAPDGAVHRMTRWTNLLPGFVQNLRFFEKDPAYIDEYLETWHRMVADWTANHTSGNFQYNMTDFYVSADRDLLYPAGYGLVVFDFQNDHILYCQGYSSLIYPSSYGTFRDSSYLDELTCFDALVAAGRVLSYQLFEEEAEPISPITPELITEWRAAHYSAQPKAGKFTLNIEPFTVERFTEHDAEASRQFRDRLLELDFELSTREHDEWEKWIAQYDDVD